MTYGLTLEQSKPDRELIGAVETSLSGNVILRVGRENGTATPGWHQIAHIVLTPLEAEQLARDILDNLKIKEAR